MSYVGPFESVTAVCSQRQQRLLGARDRCRVSRPPPSLADLGHDARGGLQPGDWVFSTLIDQSKARKKLPDLANKNTGWQLNLNFK